MAIIGWLIVGLIAGLIARLLIPGRQPIGLLMTMVLGLAGSLLGGFISTVVIGPGAADQTFHPGGLLLSILGALLILGVYVGLAQRRA